MRYVNIALEIYGIVISMIIVKNNILAERFKKELKRYLDYYNIKY